MGFMDWLRPRNRPNDGLTAAVQPINLNTSIATPNAKPGATKSWQQEAWQRFEDVGELASVCQWFSNSLSRVRLVASDMDDGTGQPTGDTIDEDANRLVMDIAGGPAGQAAMLSRLATFLTVPGEAWVAIIVGRGPDDENIEQEPSEDRPDEEWHVVGDTEINTVGKDIEITLPDGTKHILDPEQDSLFRVHRPHPRRSVDAYSPVMAALPSLREIRRCDQKIEAAGKSRIAGNGLLAVPTEVSVPTGVVPTSGSNDAPGLPGNGIGNGMQPVNAAQIMQSLQQAMTTSITDQSSAAAMVPIVMQAPGEWVDKIKHITLNSDVIETDLTTREKAIHRLALSLDVPPEVLLGNSDSNHWSAWASRDEAISQHIAPMMTLICDALTVSVLRPLLQAQGHPNPDSVVVWFDLSDLARRPDRRDDAGIAFDRGVISADAYRQELGYGDDDAPIVDTETAKKELAVTLVSKQPSLYPYFAELLGFDLPDGLGLDGTPDTRLPTGRATSVTPLRRSSSDPTPDTQKRAEG